MKNRLLILASLACTLFLPSVSVAFTPTQAHAVSNQCSRYFTPYENYYAMPANMIRAISTTESGRWIRSIGKSVAWPWTINARGKGYHFDTKEEAIAKVKALQKRGYKSIDIGCMQINLKYHPDAFHNLEQAFEPKYNIGYASSFLTEKFKTHKNWNTAIRLYHSAHPKRGRAYLKRVHRTWKNEDKSFKLAMLDTANNQPVVIPKIKVKKRKIEPLTPTGALTKDVLKKFAQ